MLSLSAQTGKPKLEYAVPSVEEAPTDTFPEEKEPDINAIFTVEKEPKPLNLGEVRRLVGFLVGARSAKISVRVVARVLVGKEGSYVRHKIIKSTDDILKDAVEKKLPLLRFTPAMHKGEPVMFWVNIPFKFKMLGY